MTQVKTRFSMGSRQSSMDSPDAIALPDRVQHGSPALPDDNSKDRVYPVEVRLGGMGNEILAPSGVGARESHTDDAQLIADGVDLVADREPGPAPPVAGRITVLHDEVRDHPMPARALEV